MLHVYVFLETFVVLYDLFVMSTSLVLVFFGSSTYKDVYTYVSQFGFVWKFSIYMYIHHAYFFS
jgi:hypothetical protein